MSGLISLELGRVAHLTLVNPPLNLVTEGLLHELAAALDVLEAAAPGDVREQRARSASHTDKGIAAILGG